LPAALRPTFTALPLCPKTACSKLKRACFPRRLSERILQNEQSEFPETELQGAAVHAGRRGCLGGIYALCKAAENFAAFYADKLLYFMAMQAQHLLFTGQ